MPLIEYLCRECGRVSEELKPINGNNAHADCDECGRGMMDRVVSAPASIRFGTGVPGHFNTHADGSGNRC